MRRDDQRDTVVLQPIQPIPHDVPRLRVEARRRLVEQQQVRLVDQRASDRQATHHAAAQLVDDAVGPLSRAARTRAAPSPCAGTRLAGCRSIGRRATRFSITLSSLSSVSSCGTTPNRAGSDDRAWQRPSRRCEASPPRVARRNRSFASSSTCRRHSDRGSRRLRRGSTSKSMASTATKSPYCLARPRAETSGSLTWRRHYRAVVHRANSIQPKKTSATSW